MRRGCSGMGDRFFRAPHDVMDHPSFRRLSATAQAAWLHFGFMYDGRNNGRIQMSSRRLADRLNVSKNSAARAINDLETFGFLNITEAASFYGRKRGASYRLTHLKCDRTGAAPSNVFMNLTPKVIQFKPKRNSN